MNVSEDLKKAMAEKGYFPETIETDGKIRRFQTGSSERKNLNGWYICFNGDGFAAAAFGDWSLGDPREIKHTWCSKAEHLLTPQERISYSRKMEKIKEQREHMQKEAWETTARKAQSIWKSAKQTDDQGHSYLVKKNVVSHGLRTDRHGNLLVPLHDETGKITSLQMIAPDGKVFDHGKNKLFMTDGKKTGCSFIIPGIGDTVYFAEGYSTGATCHSVTGETTVVCFDAGNISEVVRVFRTKYPKTAFVILADNDRFTKKPDGTPWNPGVEKARKAGELYNARVIVPVFRSDADKPTDFNDLMAKEGLEEVRKQILEEKKCGYITLADILKNPVTSNPIIEGIFEEGDPVVIYAPGGTGKSLVALHMALHLALGGDPNAPDLWERFPIPKPRASVFLQSENSRNTIHLRAAKMLAGCPDYHLSQHYVFFPEIHENIQMSGHFSNQNFRGHIVDLCTKIEQTEEVKTDILFVDPLISFHDADENDNARMRHTLDNLLEVCNILKTTPVVIHHAKKDGMEMRGASAIRDWARCAIRLTPRFINETSCIEVVNDKANNYPYFDPFYLKINQHLIPEPLGIRSMMNKRQQDRCETVRKALNLLGGTTDDQKAFIDQIRLLTQIKSDSTIQGHINEAIKYGYVRQSFIGQVGKTKKSEYTLA